MKDICLNPIYIKRQKSTVPCGSCIECQARYSREWACRCVLESSLSSRNCFLTLTFNDEFLPSDLSVRKSDLQKFVKRLRKHLYGSFKGELKYFACGEYGSKGMRPHYHIIIFGWCPDDLVVFKNSGADTYYRSATVERLWPYGYSLVGAVSYESCLYCAKYLNKFVVRMNSTLKSRTPAFVLMSKALGYGAFKQSWLDVDTVYIDGKSYRVPRYYVQRAERDGLDMTLFERARRQRVFNASIDISERERWIDMHKEVEARVKRLAKLFNCKDSDVLGLRGEAKPRNFSYQNWDMVYEYIVDSILLDGV